MKAKWMLKPWNGSCSVISPNYSGTFPEPSTIFTGEKAQLFTTCANQQSGAADLDNSASDWLIRCVKHLCWEISFSEIILISLDASTHENAEKKLKMLFCQNLLGFPINLCHYICKCEASSFGTISMHARTTDDI